MSRLVWCGDLAGLGARLLLVAIALAIAYAGHP